MKGERRDKDIMNIIQGRSEKEAEKERDRIKVRDEREETKIMGKCKIKMDQ